MDSIKEIAIANIVSLIVDGNILETKNNSVWEEILSCSGQRKLYEENKEFLTPYTYNKGTKHVFKNENPQFQDFYSGLYNIFNSIYSNGAGLDELTELLKVILDKVELSNILRIDESEYECDFWYDDIDEYIRSLNDQEYEKFITNNFSKKFKKFVRCLNILSLDVKFKEEELILYQYSEGIVNRIEDIYSVEQWLHNNFPKCEVSYNDALNNYSEGRYGSCISDCRVTVTGLFTNFKETKKWFNGILQLNKNNYRDPEIIKELNSVSKIMTDKSNGNYPRFKAIYNIYRMFCDLGAHRNEGNKIENEVNLEDVSMADALMSLRFTEDILMWAMNTIQSN